MMNAEMPTLDGDGPDGEPMIGLLATRHGGKTPLFERFRRAQLRAQMFGDPGETLCVGRYEITGRIGSGAMGTVYRAIDPSLDREVALKVLHNSDDLHRARMTIEAKALAKLAHPNVVTVHEVGTEDDQLFVAMEFVPGRTLQAWLDQPGNTGLIDLFVQAAAGLQAAHDAGIVHRDFKPENVIVGDDGRVRVLDFGMARSPGAPLLDEVDPTAPPLQALEPALTRTGLLAGTPGYMAPEQFEGARVDAGADQFAFCIALHEAVWGVRPFEAETVADLATAVLSGSARLFSGPVREGLAEHEVQAARAVVQRGLSTNPADRFASMRELSERLRGTPATAGGGSGSRRPVLLAAGLSAAVAFAGTLVFAALSGGDEPVPPTPAPPKAAAAQVVHVAEGPDTPTIEVHVSDGEVEETRIEIVEVSGDGIHPDLVDPFGPGPVKVIEVSPDAAEPRASSGSREVDALGLRDPFGPSSPAAPIIRCDDNGCAMQRRHVIDGDALLRQARVVPALGRDGTPRGFKVFGVRPELQKTGLRSGDVVTTINGIGASIESLRSLRDLLEDADTLEVVIEREGKSQVIEVDLR